MKRILTNLIEVFCFTAISLSCEKESELLTNPSPEENQTSIEAKGITIPYTVTVQQAGGTKVSVSGDDRTLVFNATDKLNISGTDISGSLDLVDGAGTSSAKFSGDLIYTGIGSPAPDLALTATLNSAPDYDSSIAGAFDLAVKYFSNITGSGTYEGHSFALQQTSSFIKFHIRITSYSEIEMSPGDKVVTVTDRNSYSVSGAAYYDGTSLSFTIAFPGGIVLDRAILSIEGNVMKLGGASQTLTANKVYNFEKSIPEVIFPTAVDLGLSVKWANINVGAKNPQDYGDYYAWGELLPFYKYGNTFAVTPAWRTGKTKGYTWESNSLVDYYDSGTYTISFSKYNSSDGKTVLELTDDLANVKYGGSWRLPTNAECLELISGCNWTAKTVDGILGFEVSSKTNENSIFLPLNGGWGGTRFYSAGSQGLYWTSTRYDSQEREAYYLTLNNPNDSWYISHPEQMIITQAFNRDTGWGARAVTTE